MLFNVFEQNIVKFHFQLCNFNIHSQFERSPSFCNLILLWSDILFWTGLSHYITGSPSVLEISFGTQNYSDFENSVSYSYDSSWSFKGILQQNWDRISTNECFYDCLGKGFKNGLAIKNYVLGIGKCPLLDKNFFEDLTYELWFHFLQWVS